MNILMLTSVYPQPTDGNFKTTKTVQYFCNEWIKQGHRVIVVQNDSKFPLPLYFIPSKLQTCLERKFQIQFPVLASRKDIEREENGIKIYRRNMMKVIPHGAYSKKAVARQGGKILRILELEQFHPDIIIGHWTNPQLPIISWLKNHMNGNIRTALVFHNDCGINDISRYSINKYIKDIDAIGCRNSTYSKQVKSYLDLNRNPFICYSGIPNEIVDKYLIKELVERKQAHSILFVGRLVAYKRLDSVIDAFSMLQDEKYTLEIIGEGFERQSIDNKIRTNDIQKRITIYDCLTRDEVFEHMAQRECFTLISENEVFGMVYLEAMLMGCITIATRGCAVDGIIVDGVNGFLCNAGDSDELTKIYKRIDSMTKDEKVEMMKKAHETAKLYSDENVAKKYLADVMNWQNTEENNGVIKGKD